MGAAFFGRRFLGRSLFCRRLLFGSSLLGRCFFLRLLCFHSRCFCLRLFCFCFRCRHSLCRSRHSLRCRCCSCRSFFCHRRLQRQGRYGRCIGIEFIHGNFSFHKQAGKRLIFYHNIIILILSVSQRGDSVLLKALLCQKRLEYRNVRGNIQRLICIDRIKQLFERRVQGIQSFLDLPF